MAYSHPHGGHRGRLRKKFIRNGLENFETHEALELFLSYAEQQKDTNEKAHFLLEKFGSLSGLFDASIDQLEIVGKLTERQAVFLKLLPEMARLYLEDKNNNPNKIIDLEHLGQYFMNKFIGKGNVESCLLLLLDAKNKEVYSGVVSEGTISESIVPSRKIFEKALLYNASKAIIAHNHPSGVALPSDEDLIATKNLEILLRGVDILLLDHIIVADDDFCSLRQSYEKKAFIIFPE